MLIGLGLFILYNLTVNQSGDDSYRTTIIVDKPALLKFMQFRSKSFDQDRFTAKLENMNEGELSNLINDYVREEVLYREALALGLDKEDYVIRRRLAQKVEFINQGITEQTTDLSDEDLKTYFEENKENYYVQPEATFTHVYFGNDVHGKEKAQVLAEQKLSELNTKKVPFTKSSEHGDRFVYNLNYVDKTPDFVTSHMGPEFAQEAFTLSPSDTVWYGPIESKYGYHLIMITDNQEGYFPDYDEVKNRVISDAKYEIVKQKSEDAIGDIIEQYDVRITYERPDNVKTETQGGSSDKL